MKRPELTDVGWLGPKYEMDSASHHFGKCSECHEIIFRTHVELKHSEDLSQPLPGS